MTIWREQYACAATFAPSLAIDRVRIDEVYGGVLGRGFGVVLTIPRQTYLPLPLPYPAVPFWYTFEPFAHTIGPVSLGHLGIMTLPAIGAAIAIDAHAAARANAASPLTTVFIDPPSARSDLLGGSPNVASWPRVVSFRRYRFL
jgi:hypothetical protein